MDNQQIKKPQYQTINGFLFPCSFPPKCVQEAFDYNPRPDDVFIVTYPRSGTTWMQHIALYIFRKGQPLEDKTQIYESSPFIDRVGKDGVARMPRPGTIKTHLPYTHMPYSPESKYIFVLRNPRDVCVSLYHHTRNMLPTLHYSDAKFNDFFELFLNGEVEYNDYCDHLLSWYPHRNDKNVFYTTYEDMKKDTKCVVLKLAYFLDQDYGKLVEKDNTVMENILKYCGYKYMRENMSELYDSKSFRERVLNDPNTSEGFKARLQFCDTLNLPDKQPKVEFIRKGEVGDWRNFFTEDQIERLNNKCKEKFKGTDIEKLWLQLY